MFDGSVKVTGQSFLVQHTQREYKLRQQIGGSEITKKNNLERKECKRFERRYQTCRHLKRIVESSIVLISFVLLCNRRTVKITDMCNFEA